jgi:hypothetical protein
VETGHEQEQQRQVQRIQADRDRDRGPVLGVVGEDLTKRSGVAGRSSDPKHRVLNDQRRG